jgi:hypothetical protein
MNVKRSLTVTIELTELEACRVFLCLKPNTMADSLVCADLENGIKESLGYRPKESPPL